MQQWHRTANVLRTSTEKFSGNTVHYRYAFAHSEIKFHLTDSIARLNEMRVLV